MRYADRESAGRALGAALGSLRPEHPLLLGLPRGGVPVAHAASLELDADLDIVLVRKLGVPWHPELAFGAIGEGGVRVLNRAVLAEARLRPTDVARVEDREHAELHRRAVALREGRPPTPVRGRVVVIIDDGMATGATAVAACRVVRRASPLRLVLAVPVASSAAVERLRGEADQVVCLAEPDDTGSVGASYDDFHQLDDREVMAFLVSGSHN